MDLNLYMRVLWRFRVLVVIGALLAATLALLSVTRLSFEGGTPSLQYRQSETWSSTVSLFVTQRGFPAGRSVYDDAYAERLPDGNVQALPRYSDPSRFSSYATLYARFATSDRVRRLIDREGRIPGAIAAEAATLERNPSVILPIVDIVAFANSPRDAVTLADRAGRGLIDYINVQQRRNAISEDKRVIVSVLEGPHGTTIVEGRSLTRPLFIFIAAMGAILLLVFVLENARPRVLNVASIDGQRPPVDLSRRSA